MEDILKLQREELSRTHSMLEGYKIASMQEYFLHIIWKSFKSYLFAYAHKKEEILEDYASLYHLIQQNVKKGIFAESQVDAIIEHIKGISDKLPQAGNYLEKLHPHTQKQEEITKHEKKFFACILECYNNRIIEWLHTLEKEIFGNVSSIEKDENNNPIEYAKRVLHTKKEHFTQNTTGINIK